MSDLHCPVTLVVARHAKAAFVEECFSDEGGSLTPRGREQARDLGTALLGRRIAAVFCSDTSRAVQTAEIAAVQLGVPVTACKSLREVDVGTLSGQPFDTSLMDAVSDRWHAGDLQARFDGGESGAEVVARHRRQLEEIADQYRGESVLVVGHQTALGIVVPTLARNLDPSPAQVGELDHAETLELDGDADGWVLRRWGSRRLEGR